MAPACACHEHMRIPTRTYIHHTPVYTTPVWPLKADMAAVDLPAPRAPVISIVAGCCLRLSWAMEACTASLGMNSSSDTETGGARMVASAAVVRATLCSGVSGGLGVFAAMIMVATATISPPTPLAVTQLSHGGRSPPPPPPPPPPWLLPLLLPPPLLLLLLLPPLLPLLPLLPPLPLLMPLPLPLLLLRRSGASSVQSVCSGSEKASVTMSTRSTVKKGMALQIGVGGDANAA
jgi:hypothetical protein